MGQGPNRRTIVAALAALAAGQHQARAAAADAFYHGKRLTLIVGFAPGGGVDTDARIIARHLPRFLPGEPSILVQNMEGAAGIIAANYLTRVAADGLTISIPGRSWFVEGAIGTGGTRFDPAKFTYIGSPGAVNSVVYIRSATGIRTFDELKVAKKPVVFGALGNLTPTAMVPLMLASHGLPVRVVAGYVSSARIIVALEQGEVDGYFTVESTFGLREELVEKKLIVPILQNTHVHPGLPLVRDVLPRSDWPLLTVVMAMETFGLPLIGPANIPTARVAELRRAFVQMCADPQYRTDATKVGLPVDAAIPGDRLAMMMRELIQAATPAVVARYKALGGAT
jgi:tripartite-type tricarboxylate transporter receptor subunit TctC